MVHEARLRFLSARLEEMRKEALIGHALIAGIGGHLGVNALGRAAHHSSNATDLIAHRAFQAGAGQSSMSRGAKRALKMILGPESALQIDKAEDAGRALYSLDPLKRRAVMEGLARGTSIHGQGVNTEVLSHAPLIGPIQRAIQHDLAGTVPEMQTQGGVGGLAARAYEKMVGAFQRSRSTPFQTPVQRVAHNVAGLAPAAALASADPLGAGVHFGWNSAREMLGRSPTGRRMMEGMMTKGLEGEMPSAGKQLAADLLASPAFLDAQRLGHAVHQSGLAPHAAAAKVYGAPVAKQYINKLPEQGASRAQKMLDAFNRIVPSSGTPSVTPVNTTGLRLA